jgi:hypothetical protein
MARILSVKPLLLRADTLTGTLVRIVRSEKSRAKQGISPVRRDPRSSTKVVSHLGDLPLALRGLATMATALQAVAYADSNAPESSYDFADSFSTQPGVCGLLLWRDFRMLNDT